MAEYHATSIQLKQSTTESALIVDNDMTEPLAQEMTSQNLVTEESAPINSAAKSSRAKSPIAKKSRIRQAPARSQPTLSGRITRKSAQRGAKQSVKKSDRESPGLGEYPTRIEVVRWMSRGRRRKGQTDIDAYAQGKITTEELLARSLPDDWVTDEWDGALTEAQGFHSQSPYHLGNPRAELRKQHSERQLEKRIERMADPNPRVPELWDDLPLDRTHLVAGVPREPKNTRKRVNTESRSHAGS